MAARSLSTHPVIAPGYPPLADQTSFIRGEVVFAHVPDGHSPCCLVPGTSLGAEPLLQHLLAELGALAAIGLRLGEELG